MPWDCTSSFLNLLNVQLYITLLWQHDITLHYITLHYITLHCITLLWQHDTPPAPAYRPLPCWRVGRWAGSQGTRRWSTRWAAASSGGPTRSAASWSSISGTSAQRLVLKIMITRWKWKGLKCYCFALNDPNFQLWRVALQDSTNRMPGKHMYVKHGIA